MKESQHKNEHGYPEPKLRWDNSLRVELRYPLSRFDGGKVDGIGLVLPA
jgi:hypothetical protein